MSRRPRALVMWMLTMAPFGLLAPSAARADESPAPIPTTDQSVHYALGARARSFFVPSGLLSSLVTQYQPLSSYSLAIEFTRRKGPIDVVVSLDVSNFNTPDGNWLAAGKNPMVDTHFVQTKGLNLLSVDTTVVWNHDLAPWMSVMLGAGLGIGLVLGEVWEVNASSTLCTAANAGDASKCYPVVDPATYAAFKNPKPTWIDAAGMQHDLSGPVTPWKVVGGVQSSTPDPDYQAKANGLTASQANCVALKGGDCKDTAEHPYYHKVPDLPPVTVVVNLIVGFKFKIRRHFNLNVSGGFRDGFFVGGGPEYVF